MKQKPRTTRRACGLLLAAAALPLTPLYAQATAPADATPPTVDAPPPVVAPAPPTATTPAPVPTMQPIVHTAPTPDAAAPTADAAPVRVRASAPTRTLTRTRRVATAEPAPAPAAAAPAPAPTPAFETPPAPVAAAPEPLPAPPVVTPPPVISDNGQNNLVRIVPWAAGALILLGLIALLLMRRRRRAETEVYAESVYDEPTPVAAPEPMIAAPIAAEANAAAFEGAVATDPVGAPAEPSVLNRRVDQPAGATMGQSLSAMVGTPATPAAAATAAATGRPSLDISMRPVRAGVKDDDAVVEFELTVDNTGSASAHDVRVSAWMFPAGSDRGSEMECMLIGDRAETKLDDVEPGDAQKIEGSVALSTEHVKEDSLLPVVAAEARYCLADGTEQRTTARFAVGVPMGGELAHFDVENPSGLHEGVEAIPIEQPERA